MNSRTDYQMALLDCKTNPAYFVKIPTGDLLPTPCQPFMPDDVKGWITVRRRVRKVKVKKAIDLEAEADLDNWEDVEHYGKATYAKNDTGATYEHNGALFDIGSRF
jgi:hypothetical protein